MKKYPAILSQFYGYFHSQRKTDSTGTLSDQSRPTTCSTVGSGECIHTFWGGGKMKVAGLVVVAVRSGSW